MNMTQETSKTRWVAATAVLVVGIVAVGLALRMDIFGVGGSGLSDPFAYDMTELRKIDPNLIGYRRVKTLAVTDEAAAVAFDAIDKTGRLYRASSDRVEIYDAAGKRIAQWPKLNDKATITGIAVGEKDVFVADAGNRVVLRYDLSGKLLGRIGVKDASRNIPGLVLPSPHLDVAIAPDGLLRVTNPGRRRVEAYTFDGDLEFWWGESGASIEKFCGCCNPTNLAILADGSIVTAEKGLPRVKVYDPQGKFVCVVAGPDDFARNAAGLDLAVDSQQRIWVLDPTAKKVHVYEKISESDDEPIGQQTTK